MTPSPIPTSLYSETPSSLTSTSSTHNYPAVLKDRGLTQKCRVPPPVPPRSPKRGGGHHFVQHHHHHRGGGESPSSPHYLTAWSPISGKPRRLSTGILSDPDATCNKARRSSRPELPVKERRKREPYNQGDYLRHYNHGQNILSTVNPKHLHYDDAPKPPAAFDGMRPPRNALHPRPKPGYKGGLSPADSIDDPEFYVWLSFLIKILQCLEFDYIPFISYIIYILLVSFLTMEAVDWAIAYFVIRF